MNAAWPRATGLFLASLLLGAGALELQAQDAPVAQPPAQQVPASERPSVADMLEAVTPAVVNIAVTGRQAVPQNPLYNDPFFRRFFNLPDQMPQPQTRQTMSVGSGVIIDAEQGYVLTNHHVVSGAEQIEITLTDRRRLPAELVGSDQATDIALLKIEAEGLMAVPISDSNTLRVGDFVVAIGNPFGIGQTVTTGIVSALSRGTGILEGGYEDFIQTDASINPGNSGGALVDYNGNLVGVNSAILAPAGGNVGIGFAVPINMAMSIVDQLIEFGEVSRGQLGVLIQDLTPDIADLLDLDIDRGAVISQVMPDSAAERAGLQAGDVITTVNGRPIDSSRALRNTIGLLRAGQEAQLVLLREGEQQNVSVTIGEASSALAGGAPAPVSSENVLQGAVLSAAENGVQVTDVQQGSRAWNNGLRPNDLIVALNNQSVQSPEQVAEILAARPGRAAVRLQREGQALLLLMN